MFYKFHKMPSAEQTLASSESGMLKIEVPHWAAEVIIFNSLLEPVTNVGKVKRDAKSKRGYSTKTLLKPGIYQVQASLEGKAVSEWIPVNKGKTTLVSPKAWENLKFTAASPLRDIDNFNKKHTDKAVELSKKITWQSTTGAKSRLFLFVRTLDPEKYGNSFFEGLALFNEKGQLITDFSEGVEIDKKQGWMGFTADLPSGGYILRRGRSGVLLRHQVFYLCDDWETHIFLRAQRFSSLSTWSLNMARRGRGFEPDSKTAQVSEAIVDSLRYGTNNLLLLQNETIEESIDILLNEKIGNPWLGILSAHMISRLYKKINELETNSQSNSLVKEGNSQNLEYLEILEKKVKPFLQNNIGNHPDVRALMLNDNSESGKIFHFPPSLMESLRLVQNHSLTSVETIPLDCLTDCVIDSLVINSPWTAWRYLASEPRYEGQQTDASSELFSKRKNSSRKKNVPTEISVSSVLSQITTSRTPVYHQAERQTSDIKQPSVQTILQDAPMIQEAQKVVLNYAATNKMASLPEKINFNSAHRISDALGQINPEDVSKTFGIPLARIEESLKSLNLQAGNLQSDEPTENIKQEKNLFSAQQAILECALGKSEQNAGDVKDKDAFLPRYVIREAVSQIQSEADRLGAAVFSSEVRKLQISTDMVMTFAEELYELAENLLKHADFILITNENGKVVYNNSTFLLLSLPKSIERVKMSEEELTDYRLAKQEEWENVLLQTQIGLSNITNLHEPDGWQNWTLSQTKIEDEAANGLIYNLNLFRLEGVPPLKDKVLQEISSTVETLVFYVPLLIYGSSENRSEYEENVWKTIRQLESRIKN